MNWTEIVASVLGVLVTGLISFLTVLLKNWITTHAKNEKDAKCATDLVELVSNAVSYFSQTTVDTLKKEGKFDSEAQTAVKNQCVVYINEHLTTDLRTYISEHKIDIQDLIESTVSRLKK